MKRYLSSSLVLLVVCLNALISASDSAIGTPQGIATDLDRNLTPKLTQTITKSERSQQDKRLLNAASKGDLKAVKSALAKGANVNAGDRINGYALSRAAAKGHVEIVKLLLNKGAKVDPDSDEGYTPLVEAVSSGRIEVAKILLAYRANPNNYAAGTTPLSISIEAKNVQLVKLLLQNRANPNLSAQGRSPMSIALAQGNREIVNLLKKAGAK